MEPAAFESDQEKIVENVEPCVSLTDENLEAFNSLSESEPNFKSAEEGSLGSMVDYSESEISCDGNISELEADDTVFTPHGSPRREDSLEAFWELLPFLDCADLLEDRLRDRCCLLDWDLLCAPGLL